MNKNIKNILKAASILIITTSFVACGEGDASFSGPETTVDITIQCKESNITTADIADYITLNSGDVIVKDDDNTTVSIYHDTNGTKKICLVSGTAHILSK